MLQESLRAFSDGFLTGFLFDDEDHAQGEPQNILLWISNRILIKQENGPGEPQGI